MKPLLSPSWPTPSNPLDTDGALPSGGTSGAGSAFSSAGYAGSITLRKGTSMPGGGPGGVGGTVLWEDDRVKIWELVLEPGEASDLHRHEHDYYLVIMSGDLVAGVAPKGSGAESFVGKVPVLGNTVAIPKGATEWAFNVGSETYREVVIEVK